MEDLVIESTKLQTSVEMLSKFFRVLSDGYNPVTLDIKIILEQRYNDDMVFALTPKYVKNDEYIRKVLDTKNDVHNVAVHLRDCFQKSLDHLSVLTIAPELFKSKFHFENFKRIINDLVDQILLFIANFYSDSQAFSYRINYEEKLFLIHSSGQCIVMKFGNHIH